jgi:hypothetical protein
LWVTISSSKTNPQKRRKNYDERKVESRLVGPDVNAAIDPLIWFDRWMSLRTQSMTALFHRFDEKDAGTTSSSNGGFLASNTFNTIVKKRLAEIGVTDHEFGGHSVRAGLATDAGKKQVETRLIKKHGGWKSDAVLLYIHDDTVGALHLNAAVGGFTSVTSPPSSAPPLSSSSSTSSYARSK